MNVTPRRASRRSLRHRSIAACSLLLVLGPTACGDPDANDGASSAACAGPDWSDDAGRSDGAPTITAPCGDEPTELVVTDLTEGTGDEVTAGSLATVDYIGALWDDGSVFDASYGRAPFSVNVGAGQVIAGWDEGLTGMKVGGRRQLVIPPELGYGSAGSPPAIPADATLVFVVELRSVATPPDPPDPVPGGTVTELVVRDEITGTGDAVAAGDTVSVHYIGVHGESGEQFDASWTRGETFTFELGSGQVIAGWDEGIVGMRPGGRRLLQIPGSLAYGAEGRPPTIGPDETLVFLVDLIGVE